MPETPALPPWRSVLAVVAHPDDESFGLGAVLSAFAEHARVSVLCFTHGEASTVHGVHGDLRRIREAELRAAARILRLDAVTLLDHPDTKLSTVPGETLATEVVATARRADADGLVVFDGDGVTGHPDHRAATAGACTAARTLGIPVLAWTIPTEVAAALNEEFHAGFLGHEACSIDIALPVDRELQRAAVHCHSSQAVPSSVLWRRLELLGNVEYLRWAHRPRQRRAAPCPR